MPDNIQSAETKQDKEIQLGFISLMEKDFNEANEEDLRDMGCFIISCACT